MKKKVPSQNRKRGKEKYRIRSKTTITGRREIASMWYKQKCTNHSMTSCGRVLLIPTLAQPRVEALYSIYKWKTSVASRTKTLQYPLFCLISMVPRSM